MNTARTTFDQPPLGAEAVERDSDELLGQVMGFVAVTSDSPRSGRLSGRASV